MYPLLETIRFEDGRAMLWSYHIERLQRSCQALWGIPPSFDPVSDIRIPDDCSAGVWKCRLQYNATEFVVDWTAYEIRIIKRLILRDSGGLDYRLKYSDRSGLDQFAQGLAAEEEILFVQDERITDTRYTNVALYNGTSWITPEMPMLQGTRRQELLDMKIIQPGKVILSDLRLSCESATGPYYKVRLFNAMIPWTESIELSIDCIQLNIDNDA